MKKLLAIIVLVLLGTMSYAQWTNGTGNDIYKTTMPGKVGIGLTAPLYTLHLYEPSTAAATCFIESNRSTDNKTISAFQLQATATGDMYLMSLRKYAGNIELLQSCYKASTATWLEFVNVNYTTKKYEFRNGIQDAEFLNSGKILFDNVGAVGIHMGTTAIPSGTLLAVAGKISCKEVEVTLTGLPDYVFNKDYKLRSLYDVENFINTNKHLPDVPSAKEVDKNGMNLGNMNATLLQKVEELTLYMINLQKENDALKARISKLEK